MDTVNYNRFIDGLIRNARKHDTPIRGQFELTPLCNLDCKMCYVHLTDPSVKARMLCGDQWIELMGQAIEHGMMIAMLTGGEAMTHPDFKEIYMYLIEQGVCVWLKTNGILLNRDMIELFAEYPPYIIDVSLYGCDRESYVAVTGHDAFETVTGNIRAAIDAGLHLRLMVTPSAYMLPWVERVMEHAISFGAEDVLIGAMLWEADSNTGRSSEDYGLSLEQSARIYRRSREMFPRELKSRTGDEEDFTGEIPEDRLHVSPRGLYCNAGRTFFAVNWDGTMGPCLDFPRDVICANVKAVGFETAWREVNQGVKDYTVPEACRACAWNTKCHYCPVQHKSFAARHLCDSAVCDWRKLQADISEEYRAR